MQRPATISRAQPKECAILKIGHGPWEYITWDEDILYQGPNLNANHFRFYSAGTGAEFLEFQPPVWFSGGPWDFTFQWNNMLRALMQNAEFKSLLRHRGFDLLDGALSVEQTIARMDSVAVHQQPEWVNHGLRWGHSPLWYPYKRGLIETFITNRHPVVSSHFDEFLASWHEDPGLVSAGGVDVAANYSFTDTSLPQGNDAWYRICWESNTNNITPLPWVETTQPLPAFSLRLNEFMAINDATIADEFGQYDDWLEIYNSQDEAISTEGLFLSDDFAVPTKWALPPTSIEGGGYLLVWCDADVSSARLPDCPTVAARGFPARPPHLGRPTPAFPLYLTFLVHPWLH